MMKDNPPKGGWKSDWEEGHPEEALEIEFLKGRMERLERENRYQRYALMVVALAAVGWIGAGILRPGDAVSDLIRAKRIEIVGVEGRQAIVLDSDRVGGRIAVRFNRSGEPPPPAAYLYASAEGGELQLYEPGANFYAFSAEVGSKGEGLLNLHARDGQKGLRLMALGPEETGGEIELYRADEGVALKLTVDATGKGNVKLVEFGQ